MTGPRRGALAVATILVLAVLTGACSTADTGTARSVGEGVTTEAEDSSPPPQDRDPQAVSALVAAIDACALVSIDTASEASESAGGDALPDDIVKFPVSPHTCVVARPPDPTAAPIVRVDVGTELDHLRRYLSEPTTVADHKAYRHRLMAGQCDITAPISFTRGIRITVRDSLGGDPCDFVTELAEVGLQRLAEDVAEVQVDPDTRPYAEWDPCLLLAVALDEHAEDYSYHASLTEAGSCDARYQADESGDAYYGEVSFRSEYMFQPEVDEPIDIAGNDGELRHLGGCSARWWDGDSGVDFPFFSVVELEVSSDAGCDEAVALATAAAAAAESGPPQIALSAPALYGRDEPDTTAIGDCLHVRSQPELCAPHQPTSIPSDSEAILDAMTADPNVLCAIAEDAVADAFHDVPFGAVTFGEVCLFVEESHEVELHVTFGGFSSPRDWIDSGLCAPVEEIEVGGLAGVSCGDDKDPLSPRHSIYVSPTGDLDAIGVLGFTAKQGPTRGHGASLDDRVERDLEKLQPIEAVAEQVVQTHFGS